MEEAEKSLESNEDRLKSDTDPLDGAVKKVSTEIKNGDGNKMEEAKNYGDESNSSEELNEARSAVDGQEKEAGVSQDTTAEMNNLEKIKDEEKKKEVEAQNGNEMKFVVEGKDAEMNKMLERVEDASDKKSVGAVEEVNFSNEMYGLGDVEAIGGKRKQEDSNPIDDISVKEMKNGKNECVEEMKDHENSKPTSGEKDEDNVLVQVEENDGGKARKEAKDMEMVGTEALVENEAPDVKDGGKLVVSEGEGVKAENGGNADKKAGDNVKEKYLKRKRGKGRTPSEIGEAKKNGDTKEIVEEMDVKGSRKRSKEVLSSPVVSSSDRPVRERKTVERLVEVIEKGPDSTVIIEKGRGTPLREIPNVAYNLARKKPAELKLLHHTLFGRKGKAVDYKSNLLQFSGFAWHESEEKQRAKIKEKLDKSVKETLLELCDLFDLAVSKTSTKKDELIVKVLDFLEAPQTMSDAVHAEKQSSKSRKRERAPEVNASKSSGGNSHKRSRQMHGKAKGTPNSNVKSSHDTDKDDGDEDEDSEDQAQKEDEVRSHSESDAEEKEVEEKDDEDEIKVDTDLRKGRRVKESPKGKEKQDVKKSPKKQAFSDTVKRKIGSNSKKTSPKTDGKSSLKTPPSKHPKDEKSNDTGENALSRNKKDAESPKKSNSRSNSKKKSSASKSKSKSGKEQKSGPTKEELRKSILEILKEVDFNTATFTDILKQLASEYKIDLTSRKAAIKLMIQEELTKMADEDEESQDEEIQ